MNDTIQEIRYKTGMSQSAFAKHFDIPVSTLRKWEQGVSSPPDYVLRLLAKALPQENQILQTITCKDGSAYYYNAARQSVLDQDGNEILVQEDLSDIKPQNLIIYLEDLFDSFYAARDKFRRDCSFDRKEDIIWSR